MMLSAAQLLVIHVVLYIVSTTTLGHPLGKIVGTQQGHKATQELLERQTRKHHKVSNVYLFYCNKIHPVSLSVCVHEAKIKESHTQTPFCVCYGFDLLPSCKPHYTPVMYLRLNFQRRVEYGENINARHTFTPVGNLCVCECGYCMCIAKVI